MDKGKREYFIYVRRKAVPVSEKVYKAYWKITEHAFLDYVLSDNRNREKLKELTEIHLREKGSVFEENLNIEDENMEDDFEEITDEE